MPLTLESADGSSAWYWYGSQNLSSGWSAAGGGVYSKSWTPQTNTPQTVVAYTLTDAFGYGLRLTNNTATPTTPAAGEFGYVDATHILYVHLPGDVSPNSYPIEASHIVYVARTYGAGKLTIKKAIARYATSDIFHCGRETLNELGSLEVDDCTIEYAENGVASNGNGTVIDCTRVTANRMRNDGFNHHNVDARARRGR